MTDELLPCPFCASRNVSNSEGTRNGEPYPYVECESCGATSEPDFWNRRAFPAPTQPVRAAPEAAADRERAASLVASEDTKRLDHLQRRGATVDLVEFSNGGATWKFRIGGLHRAVNEDIRAAIDAARVSAGEAQS